MEAGRTNNRSSNRSGNIGWPYLIAALLALIGLMDATYLTVEHLTGQSVRCTVTSGCDEVLGSAYATLLGQPLAAYGALAYFAAFSLATLAAFGYQSLKLPLRLLATLMLLASLWLLYVQAFILRAFCQYCLLSAAVTISLNILLALAWWREKR